MVINFVLLASHLHFCTAFVLGRANFSSPWKAATISHRIDLPKYLPCASHCLSLAALLIQFNLLPLLGEAKELEVVSKSLQHRHAMGLVVPQLPHPGERGSTSLSV